MLPGTDNDRQAISLKAMLTPTKTLSLETSAAQTRLGGTTTNQQGVTVSLTPYRLLHVQTGLLLCRKEITGKDSLGTAVASVSGTAYPLSFVELSGSYKSRMAPAQDTDTNDLFDTSTASVALTPLKSLRLVGTYAQNPDGGRRDTLSVSPKKGLSLETTCGALWGCPAGMTGPGASDVG